MFNNSYIKIIRFPNLIIVALTQFLLELLILVPAFKTSGIESILDLPHFVLLVISTLLIAAGGYVINDIEDYEIDLINKPEKLIISKHISIPDAWKYYFSLFTIGFLISLYLAIYVNNLPLLIIYPAAWLLLFLYSKYLKQMPLLGNIVVAIFCAFVAGIVLFAEREAFKDLLLQESNLSLHTLLIFSYYLFFAFVSTLYREIVKDIEDFEGDKEQNCRTLPILIGKKWAKVFAFIIAITFLFGIAHLYTYFSSYSNFYGKIFLIFAMVLPTLYSLFVLFTAKKKKQYHLVSQIAKFLMLSGILLLFGM